VRGRKRGKEEKGDGRGRLGDFRHGFRGDGRPWRVYYWTQVETQHIFMTA